MSATDDTDTTRPLLNSGFTWVQLYRGGHMVGLPIEIAAASRNVSHLTELVKEKIPNDLKAVDPIHLVVYRPGTPLDDLNVNARLQSWDHVPASSGPQPLMVMAPPAAVPQLGKCL
jgi:hypothetical protein